MTRSSTVTTLHLRDDSTAKADGLIQRRVNGTYTVDPWGMDEDWLGALRLVSRLRLNVKVTGADRVPRSGPVVLVCNRRFGWLEPLVLTTALAQQTGRRIRPVGCPDVEPIGSILRRVGAVAGRAEDVASHLRAGEAVALPTRRSMSAFQAGSVPLDLLAPALEAGADLVPVAITGHELGRKWTVRVGEPVRRTRGRGPGAIAALALRVGAELQHELDDASTETLWNRTSHRLLGLSHRSD